MRTYQTAQGTLFHALWWPKWGGNPKMREHTHRCGWSILLYTRNEQHRKATLIQEHFIENNLWKKKKNDLEHNAISGKHPTRASWRDWLDLHCMSAASHPLLLDCRASVSSEQTITLTAGDRWGHEVTSCVKINKLKSAERMESIIVISCDCEIMSQSKGCLFPLLWLQLKWGVRRL